MTLEDFNQTKQKSNQQTKQQIKQQTEQQTKQQKEKQQKEKQQILETFDPGGVGLDNGNIFGFPFTYETSDVIVFSVPWEVTVSFHSGTAKGPQAVLTASKQLDFYDYDYPDGWKQGIFMLPAPGWIQQANETLRPVADKVVAASERRAEPESIPGIEEALAEVNEGCERMNDWVREAVGRAIAQSKKPAILGGDHSVPFGALQALAQTHDNFGILHIDAHCDLREAYQGFAFSHASIMHNALKLPQISKLVQVGIRDVSHQEIATAEASEKRVVIYLDAQLKRERYAGATWHSLCEPIVSQLPPKVYISFDIDGLDPKLCPTTGTPVPGGLELEEAFYLLREVANRREIIGFDVCEIGPDEWGANVAARIVYKLCNLMALSIERA